MSINTTTNNSSTTPSLPMTTNTNNNHKLSPQSSWRQQQAGGTTSGMTSGFASPNNRSINGISTVNSSSSMLNGGGYASTASSTISPNRSNSRLRGLLTQVSQVKDNDDLNNTSNSINTNSVNRGSTTTISSLPTIHNNGAGSNGSFSRKSTSAAGGSIVVSSNKARTSSVSPQQQHLIDVNGFQVTAEAMRTVSARKKNGSPFDGARYYPMIPPPNANSKRHLLCLDIDETLLHASFQSTVPYDAKIVLEADGETADVFLRFRPQVREFLEVASQLFEVAIFTASQSTYADKVLRELDPTGKLLGAAGAPVLPAGTSLAKVKQSLSGGNTGAVNRLYREHCAEVSGARVKDLSLLGRPLDRVILIDNSPVTYIFQPRNAIPISSFFEKSSDRELPKLVPLLQKLAAAESVYDVLDPYNASLISV